MSCQSRCMCVCESVRQLRNFCKWSTWMLRVFSLTVALCEALVKLWPRKKREGKKNNVGLLVHCMLSDDRIPPRRISQKSVCENACVSFPWLTMQLRKYVRTKARHPDSCSQCGLLTRTGIHSQAEPWLYMHESSSAIW